MFFVLDDTIRTEEDVTRYLNLSVMGVIPLEEELENKNQSVPGKQKCKCAGRNQKKW